MSSGYIVAGGEMFRMSRVRLEMKAVEPFILEGHGPVVAREFDDPLPGY